MCAQPVIQTSFAAGELAPSIYGRVDLSKYHSGLQLARNFFVDIRGGATSRPGTEFVCRCKDITHPVRLIGFQFSTIQTYALEFGHQYMRVILDGGQVLEPAKTITNVSDPRFAPITVTSAAHGFVNGEEVYIQGVNGAVAVNNQNFLIADVTTNNFTLKDLDGNYINYNGAAAYTSGGTVARIFTLTTPYAGSDLALLKFTQSADVMTLTHPSYAPMDLTRTQHWAWTLTSITFQPKQAAPTGLAGTASNAGTTTYSYVVCAVDASGTETSRPSTSVTKTSATMSQTTGARIDLTWTAAAGTPSLYKIYRTPEIPGAAPAAGSLFGFVGSTTGLGFSDVNILPDFTNTPPQAQNPFAGSNNPGTVTYFQQRKTFGASLSFPETFWMTQPGNYVNMDTSTPSKASDAITGTIASQQVNQIKHFVSLNSLLALSSSGAWQISAGGVSNGAVTPQDISAVPQAYNGCSDVPPIVINYDILYVQNKGSIVRDLSYNFYVNLYTGTDMSILSNHLFLGHQITEWAWAEEPFKIVWAVRDDGRLLSFTYLKEQDIYGWAKHDTEGYFRSVCSISEGDVNAVYFVVDRELDGFFGANLYLKYIERLAPRVYQGDVTQAWCVDCGLQYSYTYPNTTAYVSVDEGNTPNAFCFINTGVNITVIEGTRFRIAGGVCDSTSATTSNFVFCKIIVPFKDVPESVINGRLGSNSQIYQSGQWTATDPITVVGGLYHFPGGTSVAVLADGNVEPFHSVGSNHTITLTHPASDIFVGLAYQCQMMTLDLDLGEPTVQGKRKKVAALTVRMHESRGMKVGPDFNTLREFKERTGATPMGFPVPLITGDERIILDPRWQEPGVLCIQQDYPLPATVLAVIPEIVIGDTAQ